MATPISLRGALIATATAIGLVVVSGIIGFLSHAYLEIWFENVGAVKITDFSTWPKIASGISASFDVTEPQTYRAYYGENMGGGRTGMSKADFILKNFELTGKIVGSKIKFGSSGNNTLSVAGYANADHMVLTQRGPHGGVGAFFMTRTQDAQNQIFFFGNFITEDFKEATGTASWVTQCPIVMMSEAVADQLYPTPDAAIKAFGFLQTKCTEYKLPLSLNAVL
jgi:hypothetical protein